MKEEEIIKRLKAVFGRDEVKKEVLDEYWYNLNIEFGIDETGYCYAASEVLYRLTGGNEKWQIKFLKDPDYWSNGTHYFLKRRSNGDFVDITSEQYTERGISVPYFHGKGRGLQNISNKARALARYAGLGEL